MISKEDSFEDVRLFYSRGGDGRYTRLVDTQTGEASKFISGAPHPVDRRSTSVAFVVEVDEEIIAVINGEEYYAPRERVRT